LYFIAITMVNKHSQSAEDIWEPGKYTWVDGINCGAFRVVIDRNPLVYYAVHLLLKKRSPICSKEIIVLRFRSSCYR